MKGITKNKIRLLICSQIVGTIPFVLPLVSCQQNYSIKSIDGTDWEGCINGSFIEGDYIIDKKNGIVTYTCGITIQANNLKIPDYVRWKNRKLKVYLGEQCFSRCSDLVGYVEMNSFIDTIPNYCFSECARLTGILFHLYPKSIGYMAFYECELFQKIAVMNYPTIDQNWATRLESVGDFAFFRCMLMGDLVFGKNFIYLGTYAFSQCFKISLVNFIFSDEIHTIPNGAFLGCSGINIVTLPKKIKIIGEEAFKDCTNLEHVNVISENLEIEICNHSFRNCTHLIDFSQPFKITRLGSGAFASNTNLLSLPISKSFGSKVIESQAFEDCSVGSVEFSPEAVKDVGNYAFASCSNLTVIDFSNYNPQTPPDWKGTHIFSGIHSTGTIYLPSGSALSQEWRDFLEINDIIIDNEKGWTIKQKIPTISYVIEPNDKSVDGTHDPGYEEYHYKSTFEGFIFETVSETIDTSKLVVDYQVSQTLYHYSFKFKWVEVTEAPTPHTYNLEVESINEDKSEGINTLSGKMILYYNGLKIQSMESTFVINIIPNN